MLEKIQLYGQYVRGLIGKLIVRGVNPTDRQVRNAVLKALATEPEYKVKIEVIRQTQPGYLLVDYHTH